jgi:glycerol-3-phosphate dehydrogenase
MKSPFMSKNLLE